MGAVTLWLYVCMLELIECYAINPAFMWKSGKKNLKKSESGKKTTNMERKMRDKM